MTSRRWCPHVGGFGPPFPYCDVCASTRPRQRVATCRGVKPRAEAARAGYEGYRYTPARPDEDRRQRAVVAFGQGWMTHDEYMRMVSEGYRV